MVCGYVTLRCAILSLYSLVYSVPELTPQFVLLFNGAVENDEHLVEIVIVVALERDAYLIRISEMYLKYEIYTYHYATHH